MAGPHQCQGSQIDAHLALTQGFRSYQVIAPTSHFGFRELMTLKLGQGHWMSNFDLQISVMQMR